jgi:hypothetical protein
MLHNLVGIPHKTLQLVFKIPNAFVGDGDVVESFTSSRVSHSLLDREVDRTAETTEHHRLKYM